MRQTRTFTAKELKDGQQIIIYGAGRYGELALRGLEQLNLRPAYFADRALAGKMHLGVEVISPDELSNHKDDVILIASYNSFNEMLTNLRGIGCRYYYDILALLKLEYTDGLSEYLLEEKSNLHKYANAVDSSGEEVVITHCDVVLTECCSLKCRDCANLMQYYQNPRHVDIDELIVTFHRFLDSIDALVEMRLLGGEPFLCQSIDKIIYEFVGEEKIKGISVYTNATIIPNGPIVESLKDPKVSVHLSDYGPVSSKVGPLKKLLEENGISHYVHVYDKWCDLGGIEKRNYGPERMTDIYRSCGSAQCHTFYRGKLYICPRAAHGERLGLFCNAPGEVVDYTDERCSSEEKRKEVQAWLKEKCFITACHYCNGLDGRNTTIDAGVQMKR